MLTTYSDAYYCTLKYHNHPERLIEIAIGLIVDRITQSTNSLLSSMPFLAFDTSTMPPSL